MARHHDDPRDDANDPLLGRVIDGRFTIQSVLGRGGMGVVYRAHQASLERSVALKVMTAAPEDDEHGSREVEWQRRFFLEAATVARLKHPNTITVFDYGSAVVERQRLFFIAMELLEGTPLAKLVSQGRTLSPLRAVSIALQVCRSLREAHKAGVVHRDLKPGNVMILRPDQGDDDDEGEGDFVKVLDFGLAKTRQFDGAKPMGGLTKSGAFMGSPRYSAPEQVEGRPIDARADIYSLGCVLYRMLSGKTPFDGKQPVEIMLKHLHEPVPPLDVDGVPQTLHRLVMDCLEKDPARRPPSMDAVIQRLKLARAELGGSASGIVVLSDEGKSSLPPQRPVSSWVDGAPHGEPSFEGDELPRAPSGTSRAREPSRPNVTSREASRPNVASREASRPNVASREGSQPQVASREPSRPQAASREGSQPQPAAREPSAPQPVAQEQSTPSTVAPGALRFDDSTRSTGVMSHLSVIARPPRRPWKAIAAGIVLGLGLCAVGITWRLGGLDPLIVRLWAAETTAGTSHQPPPPTGPFAGQARVRLKSTPPGADVLEMQGGLPRLLGVTPMTLEWKLAESPQRRELVLRKPGYRAARATLDPPAPRGAPSEPVWLDVDAALRPE
ncbi:MAG: protein kinase [Deltaproteobacteria bacterium]|nr:protein kinase [Deltaproteobacteria bacterium]